MRKNKNTILVIGVLNDEIFLRLQEQIDNEKKQKNIDSIKWKNDNNSTSEKLLQNIDLFLKRNKIKIVELKNVETEIDAKQKYTLFRIIKTVAKTINYCLS